MWNAPLPKQGAHLAYNVCLAQVDDPDLARRLRLVEPNILSAEQLFHMAAALKILHLLRQEDFNPPGVTGKELEGLYSGRMARKRGAARFIYDAIKSALEVCPLCNQRKVEQVDHHLPKTLYPALAVTPLNLVPICSDCNKFKLDQAPVSADLQTLHPYYENVESEKWLQAEVLAGNPAALRFFVEPPSNWNSVLEARVRYQFRVCQLGALYGVHASGELRMLRHNLTNLYQRGGAELVRQQLVDQADTRRAVHINSWQTATYEALAGSRWYCDGGFASI
ncbi:hypothetical protein ACFO1B_44035 [Dactylosporangium siamense]|uniref:HNH endonuclease n=1 Tax=Dactylosporangium siamense TaxID=685454 RepID=A0A919PYV5_9ACTN|nr:hypothetical protein [Dactylosporangium siamense]GIG52906.1 HNH endonuclease [Dactylosporangium siamense]